MSKVYIVGAKRTAIGTFGGTLRDTPATRLGARAIQAALRQSGVAPEQVDEVIMGNILTADQGMGPGRQASIYAEIPAAVPAYTVNMLCGSGMKSVMLGADGIRLGRTEIVVGGGMESMSQAPFLVPHTVRFGAKFGDMQMRDHLIRDGLTDVFNDYHMGITAENIAAKHSISRERQDEFAAASQQKYEAAAADKRFAAEIVPVDVKQKKEIIDFVVDEHPRPGTTPERLAKLRPAFLPDGTVTAGNSSGMNDGAAAIVLAGEEAVKRHNLTPLAELVAYTQAALEPDVMGLGPVPAVRALLQASGRSLSEMEVIELNEAFAAQSLGVMTEWAQEHDLTLDEILSRTNPNGGAIALGHPIGASGARILTTLLYELERRDAKTGLASLCIGGGMGTACLIERV